MAHGIGANTAIFSVVQAILLDPLPFPEPDRIVTLAEYAPGADTGLVSPITYEDWSLNVRMSAHERTFACGHVDHEFTADDLPEQARFLAGDLLCAYTSGVEFDELWDEVNAKPDVLFPVKGHNNFDGGTAD
jgi:hypothetical protein